MGGISRREMLLMSAGAAAGGVGIAGTAEATQTDGPDGWSGYRGGPRHDATADVDGPGDQMTIQWEAGSGEQPASAPAVVDGTAYIGLGSRVIAADALSGDGLWTASLDGQPILSPAVDSETVYVTTSAGSVVAIARSSGEVQWSRELGLTLGAPTTAGDALYVGTLDGQQGRLLSLNATDGSIRWQYTFSIGQNQSVQTRPTAAVGSELVFLNLDGRHLFTSGKLVALNPQEGSVAWEYTPQQHSYITAPTVSDGSVAIATGHNVHVLSATTGTEEMSGSTLARGVSNPQYPPVLLENRVIASRYESIRAFDRSSGETAWELSQIYSPAVAGQNNLYVVRGNSEDDGTEFVEISAVNMDDGLQRYSVRFATVAPRLFDLALTNEGLFALNADSDLRNGRLSMVSNNSPSSPSSDGTSVATSQPNTTGRTTDPQTPQDSAQEPNAAQNPSRGFLTNGGSSPFSGSGLTALSTGITVAGIGVTLYDMIRGGDS